MADTTPEIDQFLATHFPTLEHLEVLLLVFGSPETVWSDDALAAQLGLPIATCEARARDLVALGLLAEPVAGGIPGHRLAPFDDDVRHKLEIVKGFYRDRRISVVNAIYSAGLRRIQSFADAFRLGKD